MLSKSVEQLIKSFTVLPGVGTKTAQRMVFYLLKRHRKAGCELANNLLHVMQNVGECEQCRCYSDDKICKICSDNFRDVTQVCIVESPADVFVIESSGGYRGKYFVLHGCVSPFDGIGIEDLKINLLLNQIKELKFDEVIIATNPTLEGEATGILIHEYLKPYNLKVTKIAHGVPFGSEIEYMDNSTIGRALMARTLITSE